MTHKQPLLTKCPQHMDCMLQGLGEMELEMSGWHGHVATYLQHLSGFFQEKNMNHAIPSCFYSWDGIANQTISFIHVILLRSTIIQGHQGWILPVDHRSWEPRVIGTILEIVRISIFFTPNWNCWWKGGQPRRTRTTFFGQRLRQITDLWKTCWFLMG